MKELSAKEGFHAAFTEDASSFSPEGLKEFDVVMFLLTTGDVLDEEQEKTFEAFIRAGGGFVGVHSATDTEYDWPWYGRLVGAYFKGHPRVQAADVKIEDRRHVTTKFLPEIWKCTDEWYDFRESPRGRVHVLASVVESTYEGGTMGKDHPIMWCHEFDGGRAWYTALGHTNEAYSEPMFLETIANGIRWASGSDKGDRS